MIDWKVKVDFESKSLKKAIKRKEPETLREAGSYVRSVAINSIKTRKNRNLASLPETQPYNHTGFKKTIIFKVEGTRSVVIGPRYIKRGLANTARLHEFGGTRRINALDPKKWGGFNIGELGPMRIDRVTRNDAVLRTDSHADPRTGCKVVWVKLRIKSQTTKANRLYRRMAKKYPTWKIAKYPKRPYMGPARDRSLPKLSKFWVNSVRSF
ncbi:MAG: hypothetical protein RR415_10970 [Ruthenibacterium sp.]